MRLAIAAARRPGCNQSNQPLSSLVILPVLAITALFSAMDARAMSGLRCIVSTLLGGNPSVVLKKFLRVRRLGRRRPEATESH